MQYDVYADILFLINFSMDYLCLYICARILHRRFRLVKMVAAAAFGGIYSIVSLFLPFSPFWALLADGIVCIAICAIAFAERGQGRYSFFVTAFLFIGISMMTGGCMTAIFNLLNKLDLPLELISSDKLSTYVFAVLALIGGIISLKSGQIISRRGAVGECKLFVRFCGEDFVFSGFSDSGNLVREPISGRPVIFLDRSVFEKKLSLDFLDSYANGKFDTSFPCRKLSLVSFHTAAGGSIAVAAFPDSLRIEFEGGKGKIRTVYPDALICPVTLGKSSQGYNAVIPSEIVKE